MQPHNTLVPDTFNYVPFPHSGPLHRDNGFVGFVGVILHVAAWVMAVILDIIIGAAIDQENSPGAFQYWYWGFIALMIGFLALVSVTIAHSVTDMFKIPEGGAPPFLMTLFIGGAQISLLLTLLQMVASTGQVADFFTYPNGTDGLPTMQEKADYRASQRGLMAVTLVCKCYIVNFLQNNQAWAGPADNYIPDKTIDRSSA